MENERRNEPRWMASSNRHKIRVRHENGRKSEAVIVDVSKSGLGMRVDRHHFKEGMRVRLETDMTGEMLELQGVVQFVDHLFPRVGLRIESPDLMEKIIQQAGKHGFLMLEVRGDTLAAFGHLTFTAMREFNALRGQGYEKLDLSGVETASVGGVGIVASVAKKGARIDCCSGTIAPLFDSLGICKARLCVSARPCDLSKEWPREPRGLST